MLAQYFVNEELVMRTQTTKLTDMYLDRQVDLQAGRQSDIHTDNKSYPSLQIDRRIDKERNDEDRQTETGIIDRQANSGAHMH